MPKLPPRNKRPATPNPNAHRQPPTAAAPIYRWGQSNPLLAAGSQRISAAQAPVVTPPSTGTNAPGAGGQPGLPVDPIFSNDIGSAQRTHDTTVSGLYTQRANAAADYGYAPTYDQQGLIQSLSVDPNNPYAKANLLKKSYTEGRARNVNSFASRGQLYAGSLGVAQGIADEGYQQGSDSLQKSFTRFIANNQGSINSANTDYSNALAGADSARVSRAVANDTGEYGTPPAQTPAQMAAANGTPRSSKPPKSKPGFGDLSNKTRYGKKK